MAITTKLTATIAGTCLLLFSAFVSQSAFALSIPGLRSSGTPAFQFDVKVRHVPQGPNKSTMTITGRNDFIFYNGAVENGIDGTYNLKATFDSAGNVTGGDVSLKGAIPSLGIVDKNTVLFTADLEAFGFDPLQPMLIGFNTTNIMCDAGLGVVCTNSESVYVTLDAMFTGLDTRLRTSGTSITTIPLPAAVWLFGSGLALLGATARRQWHRT
jgi:hypothetical protein